MATKKGKREALLAALEELNDQFLRDDEFTVEEFIKEASDAGKRVSRRNAIDNLHRLVERGQLKVRQISYKSRICNAYSKP